ncbi:hypothetical protein [Streptomyces peucetius]|uniref:Uncharacterized protein n=1 Tax=Streptomyces peucetius TaxID=1950 RepID=A0ABY6IHX9_STRPE|nr:hypothetical protein [Streptomyces peucetius]UYQ65524.1 hypothetical protein OGH68_31370 [Streptomyces peucetius]
MANFLAVPAKHHPFGVELLVDHRQVLGAHGTAKALQQRAEPSANLQGCRPLLTDLCDADPEVVLPHPGGDQKARAPVVVGEHEAAVECRTADRVQKSLDVVET